jgi:hypothetical protein
MMSIKVFFVAALATVASTSVFADVPSSLPVPPLYESAGGGMPWGQTFIAKVKLVSGATFYIGDPARPNDSCCNQLKGIAYLNLYDASKPDAPVLLSHTKIQTAKQVSNGLTTFCLYKAVKVAVGRPYFIAIEASDQFGLGIQDENNSTFNDGAEASLSSDGKIVTATGNRDTSFSVKNQTCR